MVNESSPNNAKPSDIDSGAASTEENQSAAWLVRISSIILKLLVIGFACWSAWIALTVFSGFTGDPGEVEIAERDLRVDNKPAATQRAEQLVGTPIQNLVHGKWQLNSAGWAIRFHQLSGFSKRQTMTMLNALPEASAPVLPPSEELETLKEVFADLEAVKTSLDDFDIQTIDHELIDAVMVMKKGTVDQCFHIRAITRLTSSTPTFIEITPSNKGAVASYDLEAATEYSLVPIDSMVMTDIGNHTTSLIVMNHGFSEAIHYWRSAGWRVIQSSTDGGSIMLQGSRESYQIELMHELGGRASIIARRIFNPNRN